jgi:hypothetical protein
LLEYQIAIGPFAALVWELLGTLPPHATAISATTNTVHVRRQPMPLISSSSDDEDATHVGTSLDHP